MRSFRGWPAVVVTLVAVSFSLFHLYSAGVYIFETMMLRGIHLLFAMVLIFLLYPPAKRLRNSKVALAGDVLLALISVYAGYYIVSEWGFAVSERIGNPNQMDMVVGILQIVLVIEVTRRTIGLSMPIIALVFIAYTFFGPYSPILPHRGYDLQRIVSLTFLGFEGIYGVPIGVSASYIVLFIIFGAFLTASGGGKFVIDIASSLFGHIRGGPAKVSVVASGLFGTISGSAVANVVGTGTFTIPMMKSIGYRPEFAGAVEAVASTGGQFMPPVMGAAAFIIAETLRMPYISVCIAAALPAVLYYVALFVQVDLEAAKTGLRGLPHGQSPRFLPTLVTGLPFMVPIAVLIYLMGFLYWGPAKAAFWAIVAVIGVSQFRKATRINLRVTTRSLEDGARGTLTIVSTCACAGIIIAMVMLTGFGLKLSGALVQIAGGNLAILLVLTMVVSLILGMGLPTTACYIVVSVFVAPALVRMGVLPIAAHLFVFFFGIISAITPPVCIAAYTGAGLAGAPPFKTGLIATRLGIAAYIVPFLFVYSPALLLQGPVREVILAVLSSIIGVAALAAAAEGYILTRAPFLERIVTGAAAVALIAPGLTTDLIGAGLLAVVVLMQVARARRERRAQTAVEQNKGRGPGRQVG